MISLQPQKTINRMIKISIKKHQLIFKRASGTSRGILHKKNTWFIKVFQEEKPGIFGLGEINMFEGLSYDYRDDFYEQLKVLEQKPDEFINNYGDTLQEFPAIRFGLETALQDYHQHQNRILYPSAFTRGKEGIPINGLIWMGDISFMQEQIKQKIEDGFRCIKLKIGAVNFDEEIAILKQIRQKFNEHDLELRVDANGAFSFEEAPQKLKQLSQLKLHSIEQPIKQGNWEQMAQLCATTPLPIALDEELIGIHSRKQKQEMLTAIVPQYIILKPALVGGFSASEEWIKLANDNHIGWWITSALESNIGLNAIAQWTFQLHSKQFQGLGTGQLFTNNISSPLQTQGDELYYHPSLNWDSLE